jgi:acyl-homoserine lactone acylase PvdQ
LLWLTVPPDNQTLRIPGLSASVEIIFDGNGVPRIAAANELDAATALGFVHARDRMFQMELMRRAASGRLAELVGPAALPIDEQMRVLGIAQLAEADVAAQTPETRAMLEAYARGVNAWIANRGRFAALEFLYFGTPAPWRPADSLLWGRTMSLWLSSNYRTELTRLALRDKVPRRTLEQLWPPHPAPLPPQASLVGGASTHLAATATGPGSSGAAVQGTAMEHHSAARPEDPPAYDSGLAGGPTDPPTRPGEGHDGQAIAATALLAALPAFPAPFTLPSTASDAWAVDGRWSDTGAPLLAGDPHLSFDFPGLWYLVRIDTPGHVLAGATGPGTPFLVLGHNGHIAWTFTTTGADTQDVYVEPPEATFTSHQERIKVRGQPDTILTVRETRHGPVISDLRPGGASAQGPILAVAMANLRPRDTGASGLLALDHARTVEDAGKAAPQIRAPVQNLMVADHTKIGLFVTGEVPIRRHGDGWAPVPGIADGPTSPGPPTGAPSAQAPAATTQSATTQVPSAQPPPSTIQTPANQAAANQPRSTEAAPAQGSSAQGSSAKPAGNDDYYGWAGFASGDALPHIVAPASGRLVNGNEPVWPPDFPVFMGLDTFSDWRARRIRTLLASMPKHSTSDFAAMQTDVVSTYAAALLPTLRVVPGAPRVLRDWDGTMTEDAPQPLIFSAWMDAFHRAVLTRAGIPLSASSPVFEFVPFVLSPDGASQGGASQGGASQGGASQGGRSWCGGDCAPLLKATLDSTMASLTARFGPDPNTWRWGAVHQAVFAHPLFRSIPILGALTTSRIAVPGDGATLDRGGTNDALEAVHGASYRGVYDLADLDRSLFMMAPGQSGNPLSRHARDFLTRWRDGAMVLLAPKPAEVSGTVRLEP